MEWSHQKIAFLSVITWAAKEHNKTIVSPKLCWLCFPFARLVNCCYPRIIAQKLGGIWYFVQKPIKIVSNLCFGGSFLLLGSWFWLSYYYLFSYHHLNANALMSSKWLLLLFYGKHPKSAINVWIITQTY